jgi:hypothetical protein
MQATYMDTFDWCDQNKVPITEVKPPMSDMVRFNVYDSEGIIQDARCIGIVTVGTYHIKFKGCKLLVRGDDRDTIPMVILTPDHKLLASKISKVAGKWTSTPQHFWEQPLNNGTVDLRNVETSKRVSMNIPITAMFTQTQYWHWLVEDLPLFSLMSNQPILGQNLNGFELETIQPFQRRWNYRMIEGPAVIDAPEIDIFTYPNDSFGKVNPWVYGTLTSAFITDKTVDETFPKKIYITRDDADCRRVVNEDDVMRVCAAHGVTKITLSDYSFTDKVKLFHNADWIIGPHGAGLVNTMFCRPGTKILEFMTSHWVGNELGFVRFGNQAGVEWNTMICRDDHTRPPRGGKHKNADMVVDIDGLKRMFLYPL